MLQGFTCFIAGHEMDRKDLPCVCKLAWKLWLVPPCHHLACGRVPSPHVWTIANLGGHIEAAVVYVKGNGVRWKKDRAVRFYPGDDIRGIASRPSMSDRREQ